MTRISSVFLALLLLLPAALHAADAARVNGDLKVNGITFGDNSTLNSSNGMLKNRGDWSGAVLYSAGDVVQSGGTSYVCTTANTNMVPPNATYWALMAAQGPTGKTLLNGTVDPTTQGVDGDFYINTASNSFFGPKASGIWPAGVSLVGPQGPAGANYTSPKAPVLATGQQTTYAEGDDGNWKSGAVVSGSRFTDNLVNGVSNGTVTDNLTGLIWLKNTNCSATLGGVANTGTGLTWANALTWSNNLASGSCGLTDGSTSGKWRLPNRKELMSLVDLSKYNPALPAGYPFTAVQSNSYWSSSTYSINTTGAWFVVMVGGDVYNDHKANNFYVWPVRAGQ